MSCFVVPAAEALIVTIVSRALEAKEAKEQAELRKATEAKTPFYKKLRVLSNILWGGSGLLAFEHVWHGELEPWAPFLTAAQTPESTLAMFHEMSTVGVSMAALATSLWAAGLLLHNVISKQKKASATLEG